MCILDSMIGWLAPPICICCGQEGQTLCGICKETELLPFGAKCWHCGAASVDAAACERARRVGSPKFIWIATDYESTAKELVRTYKFGQQRSVCVPIADAMLQTLLDFNSDEDIAKKDWIIVPVPTATSRVRQRGFDHTSLLAREIAINLKAEVRKPLGRLGQSRQLGAKRNDRLTQLGDKFYVKNPAAVHGRNILLIDDVITTGATIIEAAKTIRLTGAKSVSALVFAKRL